MTLLLTCEHGGHQVPPHYQALFNGREDVLTSHRGWDPGALSLTHTLASYFRCQAFSSTTTRLLIEANRSVTAPDLFSEFSRSLLEPEKLKLIKDYYEPYRKAVEDYITNSQGPVLHFSIHTFTPVLNGEKRSTDVGILFDPSRSVEGHVANRLQEVLQDLLPTFQIDHNRPYLGTDDGFTTYLRTRFSNERYAGLEIEVNQKYYTTQSSEKVEAGLLAALGQVLTHLS